MAREIAVIGVGLMGTSIVRHLLSSGFSVTAYDIDDSKVDAVVAEGARRASSTAELAERVGTIILSLPNSHIVNQVVADTLRLFDRAHDGLVVIDTSTPDPDMSMATAARLRQNGVEMLDATISGTSEMFAEKDAIFLVGGREEVFDACRPVFAAMSKEAFRMGENGTGAVMKLVANLVLTMNRMALAEGLTLAKKAGLDPMQSLQVLKKSAAYSRAMDQKGERMVKKQFVPPASRLSSSHKDARLILSLGEKLNCPLPLMSFTVQAMASEISKGRQDWDPATLISFYNELAHI